MRTIYYFTADWCQPCKATRPIVENLNRDQDIVQFVFIDADSEKELVSNFNVSSIPTFIYLDEEGNEIDRTTGGKTREQLKDFIYGRE